MINAWKRAVNAIRRSQRTKVMLHLVIRDAIQDAYVQGVRNGAVTMLDRAAKVLDLGPKRQEQISALVAEYEPLVATLTKKAEG